MTYILGWKVAGGVYLAADSMLTGPDPDVFAESTFGERQIQAGSKSVSERAMKIAIVDDLAVALCGDFRLACEMVQSLSKEYVIDRDPLRALERTLTSYSPIPPAREVGLIVGSRGSTPRLFSVNLEGNGSVIEHSDMSLVQMGSMGQTHRQLTYATFEILNSLRRRNRREYLATALAILQSYGIHDYLVQDGVGGAFVGAMVTAESTEWQPDLLYLLCDRHGESQFRVGICVREGALVVSSEERGAVYALATTGRSDAQQRMQRVMSIASSYVPACRFDYVVLLHSQQWGVAVFEMNRQLESSKMRITDLGPKANKINVAIRGDAMGSFLEKHPTGAPDERFIQLEFHPFEAPRTDDGSP